MIVNSVGIKESKRIGTLLRPTTGFFKIYDDKILPAILKKNSIIFFIFNSSF